MKLTLPEAKEMMARHHGNLCLRGTQFTELPDDLIVSGCLDLSGTMISQLPENLTVGGYLDLSDSDIIQLPDNLTVGGWLSVEDSPIALLPNNLTIGYFLNISGSKITQLPDSLKVATCVFGLLDDTMSYRRLGNGDYSSGRYIYANGQLTPIRRRKKYLNYDYYVGKIPGHNVISDGTYCSNCKCMRDGIRDLAFQRVKDLGVDMYNNIEMNDQIPTAELIGLYRAVTWACQQGTDTFLKSLGKLNASYSVLEAINLTVGQYGNEEFRCFFES